MSNPGNAATQTDTTKSEVDEGTKQPETFADNVEAAIKSVTTDKDSGKQVFADGLSEEVIYAANAEMRRRETQGSFTKSQQDLRQKEAELKTVKTFSRPIPKVVLTEEQREELDDLKISNPDAWRVKMNAFENEAILKADKEHKENMDEALTANELERRKDIFETFQKNNPNVVINDDVIKNDVPPRYKQRLEAGEITFEQFLDNVKTYLSQGKIIQKDNLEQGQPNLSDVGGGAEPGKKSIELDDVAQYEAEVY